MKPAQKVIISIVCLLMCLSIVTANGATTVTMNSASGPGTAYNDQYIYNYDYAGAQVTVTYSLIDTNLNAHIVATGLKPLFTYQVKIEGPGSRAATEAERLTNERIGMSGRWWDAGNRDDAYYNSNKNTRNVIGYLVFDSFTTGATGQWEGDVKTDASYHVLFCDDTGVDNVDLYSIVGVSQYNIIPDASLKCVRSVAKLCPPASVIPQIERPGFTILPQGNYVGVNFILNEESFHVVCGTWTTAMTAPISFTIIPIDPTPVCGNHIVETGEQCDDGNLVNFDGCSASCMSENTSNALINPSTLIPIGKVTVNQCGADFGASLVANGLTPSSQYQMKLEGKPTCSYGAAGDDASNEQIGMQGRFWYTGTDATPPCLDTQGWGGCNIDDKNVYQAHKNDAGFCAKGYILFNCVSSDSSGSIINQDISGVTHNWQGCGVIVGTGTATLPAGDYNVKFLLGQDFAPWGTVGTQFLSFNIGDCDNDGDPDATDCNSNDPAIHHGADDSNCNGVDENCDGTADNAYVATSTSCGVGACAAAGQLTCVDGATHDTCTAGTPVAEICDGLDNDCDGSVDEGLTPIPAANVAGLCSGNTQTCVAGAWSNTVGNYAPGTETCNNVDDDCNGLVDDGLTAPTQSCSVGVGACKNTGTQTKTCNGVSGWSDWSVCSAVAGTPSAETCNGLDDDCDGTVDEGVANCGAGTFADGWENCAVSGGNYGGITGLCKVAWDGVGKECTDETRDATFTVGTEGMVTTKIIINHLDGIAETGDSFTVMDGTTKLCEYTDLSFPSTESWKTLICDVNLAGVKTLTLHPTATGPWTSCFTYGQVAISSIAFEASPALARIDFKGGTCPATWGVPAIAGGTYGGKLYSDFCLVWEPTCAAQTESASVNLAFTGGDDEEITISHLDGMSNLDSFDVLVDNAPIVGGHYTDSLNPSEDWVVTSFPVKVAAGIHTVTLKATDTAWNQCDSYGQIAIDYINVDECAATSFNGGWADCAVSGSNYGGIDGNCCKVAWDGVTQACTPETKDATFTVGTADMVTSKIIINHLDGIAETGDGFEVKDGNNVLCTYVGTMSGTETWKTLTCDVNLIGVKALTIHPTATSSWTQCNTYGQVAVSSITFEAAPAPTGVDFRTGATCPDSWGVPAIADGAYGGKSYNEFCLVWEPTCAAATETASVNMAFSGETNELITINHLDGMSNLDSFDVLVDDVKIGHYTDSLLPIEDWVTTSFPVNVVAGIHTVTLKATDAAWSQCDSWGQIAIDSIKVEHACELITSYRDVDGDGYGNNAVSSLACSLPAGFVTNNLDCNDADAAIHPGAPDALCNGVDNNCNGQVDEGYVQDSSCFLPGACAAADVASTCVAGVETACQTGTPGVESCNGLDDDCDGSIDEEVTNCGVVGSFGATWADCALSGGNYGGITGLCKVAWDGVGKDCTEPTRDATFTVGTEGMITTKIIINHLDGIAETGDSFEVMDGTTKLSCEYTDLSFPSTESWKTLTCNDVRLYGVKTLTLHPLASSAWSSCYTYGQVAISSITFQVEEPVYHWEGFFQPVDNPILGTFNKVKAGSAIPVKFSLGGNMGLNIFAADYPKVNTIACPSASALTDDIEQTVTAAGGSSLTYDPITDQYTYVWKTNKAWAGTCRLLTVKLSDGTTQTANFKFTK